MGIIVLYMILEEKLSKIFFLADPSWVPFFSLLLLLLLLILLLLIYIFFHFTGEEPEAQKKEKVICCRSYNENQPGVK